MADITREQLPVLYKLQNINVIINDLEKQLAAVSASPALAEVSAKLKKAIHNLKLTTGELEAKRQMLRQKELDLAALESENKNLETTLYQGQSRNVRELNALQKKLLLNKEKLTGLEEEILTLLQQVEALEESRQKERKQAEIISAEYNRLAGSLNAESAKLQRELERARQEREQVTVTLDPSCLQRFARLTQDKGLVVIAKIHQGTCSVCGVEIPPGLLTTVQKSDRLSYCESCGRLLF
ncbi:MAG TPA: hypothetical protein GXX29_03440 [Firmicutes bacterium]|nr:hypothetical protein [Bacillota bacterium]